jgi:NAD(P)-dependent dehydrogenase (short-subunit alcohol dehydrogenase family)
VDVSHQDEVDRAVQLALERWGRVDYAIANAGQYVRAPVASATAADFQQAMAVNFFGALYLVLAVLPQLRRQGSGHIVLVSSMDGKKGVPPDSPYVASKFALTGFGEVLRQELHGTSIGVSTIFPGRVDTPLIDFLHVPWLSAKIPANAVAAAIIGAMRYRRAEVILPHRARLLLYVNNISPRLGDWAVRSFHLSGSEKG